MPIKATTSNKAIPSNRKSVAAPAPSIATHSPDRGGPVFRHSYTIEDAAGKTWSMIIIDDKVVNGDGFVLAHMGKSINYMMDLLGSRGWGLKDEQGTIVLETHKHEPQTREPQTRDLHTDSVNSTAALRGRDVSGKTRSNATSAPGFADASDGVLPVQDVLRTERKGHYGKRRTRN